MTSTVSHNLDRSGELMWSVPCLIIKTLEEISKDLYCASQSDSRHQCCTVQCSRVYILVCKVQCLKFSVYSLLCTVQTSVYSLVCTVQCVHYRPVYTVQCGGGRSCSQSCGRRVFCPFLGRCQCALSRVGVGEGLHCCSWQCNALQCSALQVSAVQVSAVQCSAAKSSAVVFRSTAQSSEVQWECV